MQKTLWSASLWLLPAIAAAAAPKPKAFSTAAGAEVPAPLAPWVQWVRKAHPEAACPFFNGEDQRHCAWPTRIGLSLLRGGGRFEQSWSLFNKALVPLPGDDKHWPQDVRVDGAVAPVVDNGGTPMVELAVGTHRVEGRFEWDALPVALAIPAQTGLVALSIENSAVAFPRRDAAGRLMLKRSASGPAEAQRLDMSVHRRFVDDVPLFVTTQITLEVSGGSREVILAKALLDGFGPMSLESKLPARLEADGRLRVQVRPGKWVITLEARQLQKNDRIPLTKGAGEWAAHEVWVFTPQPNLRLVEVSGLTPIDPQQTTIPAEWRKFSTYRASFGGQMVLKQRRRGDSGAALDQLTLKRVLWLDFAGKGLTISDRLSGTFQRSGRLEMRPTTALGRVSVDGNDRFITKHGARVGVELPRGAFHAQADSRYVGAMGAIPAVGWNHDVRSLSATLRLPPGWQLFSASGVDRAPGTWIGRWTLLDMFFVLVISLSIGRLFGWSIGGLALVALVLTFSERDAPQAAWFVLIALEALRRVLPSGWLQKSVALMTLTTGLSLVLIALPFALQQVRQGVYPILEHPHGSMSAGRGYSDRWSDGLALSRKSEQPASVVAADKPRPMKQANMKVPHSEQRSALRSLNRANYGSQQQWQQEVNRIPLHDPNAVVQTGPGLPLWRWNSVALSWSGPVRRNESLGLTLIPPRVNLILGICRAASLLALLLVLALVGHRRRRFFALPKSAALLAVGWLLLASAGPAQAQFPPSALLDQLATRLMEKPPCFPRCASASRMALELANETLTLRLQLDAAAPTAVPLPGRENQWRPATVLLDGAPATGLARHGGLLWLALAPGRHQVQLAGPLPRSSSSQLSLPLKPRRVEIKAAGWRVDGVHENATADDTLTLTRVAKSEGDGALQPGELPPFVQVRRRLTLGLTWEVETVVQRLTPRGSPVVLAIPLLPGEMVTDETIRVEKGMAHLQLSPDAGEARWRSALERRSELKLQAVTGSRYSELWEVFSAPIWHLEASGIPPIHEQSASSALTSWRPWPGEQLSLKIFRPKGIGGQSMTIDGAHLVLRPGRRATDATLTIQLRSSRGGGHRLTIPPKARVQKVLIGKVSYPVRQDGASVAIPVSPGKQQVRIEWRQPEGITGRYRAPALALGGAAVNARVTITVPQGRWVLAAGGATAGPVVLFWSLLAVLLVVALVLSRIRWTPLRVHHWLLLSVGLSQVPIEAAALVAGWLIAMGWRQRNTTWGGRVGFNLRQVALGLWLLPVCGTLFGAIHRGLLGRPEMQIRGNASSSYSLEFFVDRVSGAFPEPWMLSVPLWVYRLLMLAWALWLAWALVSWSRWSWGAFKEGALWKPGAPPAPRPAAPGPTPAVGDGSDPSGHSAGSR